LARKGAYTVKLHYIHSQGGRIGGGCDTTASDIDAIVEALRQDSRRHLVLHFHGGLVSKTAGLAIADRLFPVYSPSTQIGGYPVFFVWESGAWETIRNNITELASEPVFKQLLRKVLQYALERLGGHATTGTRRSIPQNGFGTCLSEVETELNAFWAAPSKATIPFRGFDMMASASEARSATITLSEDEIIADLEGDADFLRSLATLPDLPPGMRSSFPGGENAIEHRSQFSELASRKFSKEGQTRGLVELYLVARYITKVLRGILLRYGAGRDHGLYATCVEELIRAFTVVGTELNEWGKALQWNRMKKDTRDAFGADANLYGGTALLARLQAAIAKGFQLNRVTLVGHSTGAIYIAHWLENSSQYLPRDLKQDVVFLAPAITYDQFAETLRQHASLIGNFRMFAMTDELERDDQVWGEDEALKRAKDWRRFIYPSSLLYLVSGLLESSLSSENTWLDEPDMALVGMERFFANSVTYPDSNFASIKEVREWLRTKSGSLVWSTITGQPAGFNSNSIDHGAFDDDGPTLESLGHIVRVGY
jgi:pimeloyl-ACP methyl ester carboxylesterase